MKKTSGLIILIIAFVVMLLCSCQQKNVVTNLNGSKAQFSVDPSIISFTESMHTDCVTRFLTNSDVMNLVDAKRTNNQDYFTEGELAFLNATYLDIVTNYKTVPEFNDYISDAQKEIAGVIYSYNGGEYSIKQDYEENVKDITTFSRDYSDIELGPIYTQMDEYMDSFKNDLLTYGYTIAYDKLISDTDEMASGLYPSKESAELAAGLIGVCRSSASLVPDYETAFGRYSSDPLTYPLLTSCWSADWAMFGYGWAGTFYIPPQYLPWPWGPAIVTGGAGIASATYAVCSYIHNR